MIGGIAENFGTSCRDAKGSFFITEGDEYDTAFFDKRSKFFHYLPEQLILNNLEFDHADIFNSLDEIKKAFRLMLRLIPKSGLIAANGDDPNVQAVLHEANSPVIRFGFGKQCDLRVDGIKTSVSGTKFDVIDKRQGKFSQKHEFELHETQGFKAVKHQSFVGTSYFDAVQNTVAGGESSTAALKESTETEQFNRRVA